MKTTSLEQSFISLAEDGASRFEKLYRDLRETALTAIAEGKLADTIDKLTALANDENSDTLDRAALLQTVAALYIEADDTDNAIAAEADALSLLASEARRKDNDFLLVLGALLYDLAFIHNTRKEYKAAERTLSKAIKVFERLAKYDTARFGQAHIHALNAATAVYRSHIKQVNLLAHYQVATTTYLNMVNSGIKDAMERLIESLKAEGETLMKLGKHKNAVHYFTRALKYLTKLEPELTARQLDLSVMLGEALMQNSATRQKGVHLLNTLLQKANKLNLTDTATHIEGLLEKQSGRLDILGIWHKIFPR